YPTLFRSPALAVGHAHQQLVRLRAQGLAGADDQPGGQRRRHQGDDGQLEALDQTGQVIAHVLAPLPHGRPSPARAPNSRGKRTRRAQGLQAAPAPESSRRAKERGGPETPPPTSIPGRPRQPRNGRMMISTRRFWARPSGVSLLAIGARSPMPATYRRSRSTLRLIR